MKAVRISDITLRQKGSAVLTFKEKLELVKLLDKLGIDCIELSPITRSKADSLCIKSIAQTVRNAAVAVPASLENTSIDETWEALKEAAHPVLQIICPVSSVQMEYIYHSKPAKIKEKICAAISYCRSLCADVEFIADDATRAEKEYLYDIIGSAIEAGATRVAISDDAGNMLPDEYRSFIAQIREGVKNIDSAVFSVYCCDKLAMADICSVAAVIEGADGIKLSAHPEGSASLSNIAKILGVKGEAYGIAAGIKTVEIKRITDQIDRLFTETKNKTSIFDDGGHEDRVENVFTVSDGIDVISKEILRLGYDLSEEDKKSVYDTFVRIAGKKAEISSREIETIIASTALQVPPAYILQDFIINSGNSISATCHMKLVRDGKVLESVALGDGPVDASYLAIEMITGHHFELDDFQIQSVTEGRTAMGETIVKLRADGKLYSGRGLSTDIIGAAIHAYINALNKIVYEEENS